MGNLLEKVLDFFETTVSNICFALMCCFILIQVIFRISGLPLAWTEEVARYLFVWVIYLSAGKAVKLGRHMSVDILPLILKGKAKQYLFIFANLVCLIFLLVLGWYCFKVLERLELRPQFSAANGINLIYAYAAPAIGSILMVIRCMQNIIMDTKNVKQEITQ